MKNLFHSVWSSGIILLLTLSGPVGTALYSHDAISLDVELFGPPAHAQETLDDSVVSTVTRLPAVGARNIRLTPSESGDSYEVAFDAVNYEDYTLDDLYYKVLLIDPATSEAVNTISAESYLTYDVVLSTEKVIVGPQSSERIRFTYTPPEIAAGEYRLRVRLTTKRDEQLGWADGALTISDTPATFATIEPDSVTLDRDPAGHDRPEAAGFSPLHGVAVTPGTVATLNYRATNVGTTAATLTPHLTVKEWGMFGEEVATHTGDDVTLAPAAVDTGALSFTVPDQPGAYRLELVLNDGTTQASSIGEYRIVVAGISGRILSAEVNEITDGVALLTARVVGPADRVSSVDATVTGSLLDGDDIVAEVTTDSITLDELGSREVTFRLPLAGGLTAPRARLTLTAADGSVLDTYEFEFVAEAATVTAAAAAIEVPGSNTLLAIIAVFAVIVIALVIIVVRSRGGNTGPPTSGTIATLLGLAIVSTFLITGHNLATAQGPGAEFYFEPGSSVTSVFINSPIHENSPLEPDQAYDQGSIPFEIDMSWNHCANRVSYGGFAIDHPKAVGHVYPTAADWIPAHDLIKFSQTYFGGSAGFPSLNLYEGTQAGAADWTVLMEQEVRATGGSGIKHNTFTGTVAVPEAFDKATLRVTGYARQRVGVSAGNPEPAHSWFGTFTHLNFTVPAPPPPPAQPPTAGISAPTNIYLGSTVSAVSTSHAFVSAAWQNQRNPLDVNNDGSVSPIDFLQIGNLISDVGNVSLPYQGVPPYVDVNGDGSLSAADAIIITSFLNRSSVDSDVEPPATTGSEWQNQTNPLDTNNDGSVSPSDVLAIGNAIHYWHEGVLPDPPAPYYDVNADRNVTGEDATAIEDALNAATVSGIPPNGSDLACCNDLDHSWLVTFLEDGTDVTPTANTGKNISFTPAAIGSYLIRLTVTVPGADGGSATDDDEQPILDPNNGQTFSVRDPSAGNPFDVTSAVADAITAHGLPLTPPTTPLLAETGGTGGGFRWNDDGTPHTATLDQTCLVLGYSNVASYSTLDGQRASYYPNGKHNFHSPGDDSIFSFDGNDFVEAGANPKYGNRFLSSITCRDRIAECSDGWDNDNDGVVDAADPSCHTDFDATNAESYNANIDTESAVAGTGGGSESGLSAVAEHTVLVLETGTLPVCPPPYLDVDGDGFVTNDDATTVTRYMSRLISPTPDTPPAATGAVFQNQINTLDVNNDGTISPIDALLIINSRNKNTPSETPTTLDPVCTVAPPAEPPTCPAPYLDVNGDGYVSAVDILIMTNHINGSSTSAVPTTGAPWQNQTDPLDVNNDGAPLTPIDILNIINYLNAGHPANIGVHSCVTTPPPPAPTCPPPFLDVNGDGFFSSIDMLVMINHLNGSHTEPVPTTEAPWQNQTDPLDVNGDGTPALPIDSLLLINGFNAGHDGQLGTPSCATPPPTTPPTTPPTATPTFDPGIFREIE